MSPTAVMEPQPGSAESRPPDAAAPRQGAPRLLDRPIAGPVWIALLTTLLFHLVVGLVRPAYWGSQSTWDEGYYVGIARVGYELPGGDFGQPTRIPFSPGYPLLLRATSWLTSVHPQFLRAPLGVVLFTIGCLALGYALRAFSSDHRRNNLAILVFALWPGSLYFRSGYAEALYFPLVAASIGCLLRRRYLTAAWLAAACWFTRTPGVVVVMTLAASVAIDALRRYPVGAAAKQVARTLSLALPIASLGLLVYAAMLWASVGDPFAFLKSYVAWEPCKVQELRSLKLKTPVAATVLFTDRPTIKIALVTFLVTPLVIWWQRRKMPAELTAFAACAWLFFLANDWVLYPFHDMMRWMAIVFPLHYAIVLGIESLGQPNRTRAMLAWLALSTVGYVWYVSRYVRNEWVS